MINIKNIIYRKVLQYASIYYVDSLTSYLKDSKVILDYGSGIGVTANLIQKNLNCIVYACDKDEYFNEYRENNYKNIINIDHNENFSKFNIDTVLMFSVAQYIKHEQLVEIINKFVSAGANKIFIMDVPQVNLMFRDLFSTLNNVISNKKFKHLFYLMIFYCIIFYSRIYKKNLEIYNTRISDISEILKLNNFICKEIKINNLSSYRKNYLFTNDEI